MSWRPRPFPLSKATCTPSICKTATLHRGRGSHHAQKVVVGTRETRPGPPASSGAGGRGGPEDGLGERTEDRTQSRKRPPSSLARVHEAASRDKKTRFTALLHHVNVEALERAFGRLKRGAAAGVDGETVATYEQGLSEK